MKKKYLITLVGLMTVSSSLKAQSQDILPQTFIKEAQEFNDAVRKVHIDYTDTELLERFIERHPSSRYTAQALLELERAQILATGTYEMEYASPTLSQLTPSEEHFQYFYENQKELGEDNPDYAKLRQKYQQLLAMNDVEYSNEATYYLGYIDYIEGKYDDALNRFNGLPYDEKYESTVPFYKMQIQYAKGNWNEALDIIESSAYTFSNLSPEQQGEVDRIKAECLARTGQNDEALSYFRKYIDEVENPVCTSAYNCAVLANEANDIKLVQKALSKAVEAEDATVRQYSYMLLGQSYLQSGESPKAEMAFDQASSIDADRSVQEAATYNKAVLVHETSYSPWGNDVEQFENFLNTYPNSQYTDNVSNYLTEVYMTTKNYDSALASIKKIKNPNQTILDAKQRLLYQCGINDYVNADFVSANNHFTECISVKSTNNEIKALANYWRGESRYHLDFLTDAAEDYKTFNSLSSTVSDVHIRALGNYSLAYVYFKKQDFNSAHNSFEQYVSYPNELTTTYYDALCRLGDCEYYSRNFSKAESYYATVADSESASAPYALYQQAFMLGLQKKYSQKQNVLDKLIAVYPENEFVDEAWLEKGNTSILQNETNAAINSFKYIVDNYPNAVTAPTAAVQLAMAYNNSGQPAEAQKVYEMVAEKYPNTDEATTALQDLKTLSTTTLFAEMPKALSSGNYDKVIENYQKLSKENVDFRDLQKIQLMAAKAYLAKNNNDAAIELLTSASQDVRTQTGSEAKYMLAQNLFDNGKIDQSLEKVTEFIQEGSPYQYWLARSIILMSDISVKNGDTFTASEYLKSLQSNYSENDDISSLINSRLSNLK